MNISMGNHKPMQPEFLRRKRQGKDFGQSSTGGITIPPIVIDLGNLLQGSLQVLSKTGSLTAALRYLARCACKLYDKKTQSYTKSNIVYGDAAPLTPRYPEDRTLRGTYGPSDLFHTADIKRVITQDFESWVTDFGQRLGHVEAVGSMAGHSAYPMPQESAQAEQTWPLNIAYQGSALPGSALATPCQQQGQNLQTQVARICHTMQNMEQHMREFSFRMDFITNTGHSL